MNSNEINNLFDEYRAYNDAFYQKLVQIVKELASKDPNGILKIKIFSVDEVVNDINLELNPN